MSKKAALLLVGGMILEFGNSAATDYYVIPILRTFSNKTFAQICPQILVHR